jgi:hypothetical protein
VSEPGLSERPTPETDAYLARISERRTTWDTPEQWAQACQAMTDHARRLERERDAWSRAAASSEILRKKAECQRDELRGLLAELIDIEGPCPGTAAWADRVRAAIAKAAGKEGA